MAVGTKNWNAYVANAEEITRGSGFCELRDRILDLADPVQTDVAVDVGAGTGLLTLPLAERTQKVWAIDISPLMGECVRTKASSAGIDNIEVATASAVSLPLVDGTADLVVSNYCFHHLNDDGKRRALSEIYRVLEPGGRLVFGDMMFRLSMSHPRDRRAAGSGDRACAHRRPRDR